MKADRDDLRKELDQVVKSNDELRKQLMKLKLQGKQQRIKNLRKDSKK